MPRMLARAGIVVALLVAPALASAAFDTVSMDTTVVLSVGGYEIDVSGSTATVESITVNASTFSFDLQSGSSIQVTAPNLNKLTADSSADNITDTCNDSQSITKYVGTSAHTITITPSATLCSGASSPNNAGSQRNTTSPVIPAVPATHLEGCAPGNLFNTITGKSCTVSATPATPALQNASSNARFARDLQAGKSGDDVKVLQKFLNAHGYSVASSGPGSSGNETSTFGGLTRAALAKYQKAKGITPAVGYFGAKTRAAMNAE